MIVDVNEEQRRRIIEEVAEFSRPPLLGEDEFTRRDYQEETGMSVSGAGSALARLVDAGVLSERDVYDPRVGRKCRGYRRAES